MASWKNIFGKIGQVVGGVLGGAGGAIFGSMFGGPVPGTIISAASAEVFSEVLERLGQSVGSEFDDPEATKKLPTEIANNLQNMSKKNDVAHGPEEIRNSLDEIGKDTIDALKDSSIGNKSDHHFQNMVTEKRKNHSDDHIH